MNVTSKIAAVVAAAGLGFALSACGSSAPHITPACKQAVAQQNAYVRYAVAQGYPNVDIVTGGAILKHDLALLNGLKPICPPTVKVLLLPS